MYEQKGAVIPMMKARNRTVGNVIPIIFPILLAIFQMILYLAIIGLEAASVYYDPGRGTIYAGFWCSLIFLVTWIAMFCYVCLKKLSCCGIYLIAQNTLSAIFAVILIAFTAVFIDNPCLCYGILCQIPTWDYTSTSDYYYPSFRYECTVRTNQKLPVLKGLLSCAVLMFVSNLISIAVCLINSIRLLNKPPPAFQIQHPQTNSYQSAVEVEPADQYQLPYLAPAISEAHYYAPTVEPVPTTGITNAPLVEIRSMKF